MNFDDFGKARVGEMGAGRFWEVESIMEIKTTRSIQMIVQIINEEYDLGYDVIVAGVGKVGANAVSNLPQTYHIFMNFSIVYM